MKKQIIAGGLLTMFSMSVMAHSGHPLSSMASGFIHPFTGLDHLLMMLAVGVLSAQSATKAKFQLPLVFVLMLAVGASLGFIGFGLNGLETAIAISVVGMGLLLTFKLPMTKLVRMIMVGVIAMLHGLAHGVELGGANYIAVILGMSIATVLLSGLGLWIGVYRNSLAYWFNRGLALLMVGVGSALIMY